MSEYKRNKATLKRCNDARNGCFAQTETRKCLCLEKTNFSEYGDVCPFYKTRAVYIEGLKKYGATKSY